MSDLKSVCVLRRIGESAIFWLDLLRSPSYVLAGRALCGRASQPVVLWFSLPFNIRGYTTL